MTDRINCPEQCEVPEGVQLVEVPRPRHAWTDVLNCPNDGCERSFMAKPAHDGGPDVAEAVHDDRTWDLRKTGE